jgi:small subunit ribosomal protein S1
VESIENAALPSRLEDLKPSMKLEGRVTKIELFGAFVDVGAEREGMVHISMLKQGHVNRVEDVVQEGQQVEVWVHRVDPNAGRLELTMIRPVQLKWKDIHPSQQLKGKVVRLESFGAFIDVGAERPGLVHVSELSTEYVSNPSEIVSVGDKVDVRVIDVDRRKRQIRLSMKEASITAVDEEEEAEEQPPTAMEFALRQALEQSDEVTDKNRSVPKSGRKDKRPELEDILARTLKHRVRTASSGK